MGPSSPIKRRGSVALGFLGLVLGAAVMAQAEAASPILAVYDFEREVPSGPDTFRLFEQRRGRVVVRDAFQVSGRHALELREGAGDGCFSEFLATFATRRTGRVVIQFQLLMVDPEETFNIALAGPRWFMSMEPDGHAFWLSTRDGALVHRPAGHWQPLLVPRAFTWYFVEVAYDPTSGRYDLWISEEGLDTPVVERLDQRNTADAAPSAISYFSLVGDLEDTGEAVVYMDDLVIATDPAIRQRPFVAPGRRDFFVDTFAVPGPELDDTTRADWFHEARQFLRGDRSVVLDRETRARFERVADEAFRGDDLGLADELYGELLEMVEESDLAAVERLLAKSADVYHRQGDVEAERRARESIYGRLRFE